MFIRTPFCSLLACTIALLFFSADAAHGQRRQIRIGGQNGVVIGGGQGVVIGGSRGVQFGGGQGARFGPAGRGVQFGGGQGVMMGPQYAPQYGVQPQYAQGYPAGQPYQMSPDLRGPMSGQPSHVAANGVFQSPGNFGMQPGTSLYGQANPNMNGYVPAPADRAEQIAAPQPNSARSALYDRRISKSIPNGGKRLNDERANVQGASRATYDATPAVLNQPEAIMLRYPKGAKRSLSYTVNGSDFQLAPGNSLRMQPGQTWKIGVADGDGDRRQYLLDETKEYVLEKSGSGWILDAKEIQLKDVPTRGVPIKAPNRVVTKAVPAEKSPATAPVTPPIGAKTKSPANLGQPKSVLEFNDSK